MKTHSTTKLYVPDRGDIVWLNFAPQAGHEQSGMRPALILSPQNYNRLAGLALACPITSKIKNYPFEVLLPKQEKISGVVLSDQIKSLDWRIRQAKFIIKTSPEVVDEVTSKVHTLFETEH